jgi:hypothetical protein
MLVIQNGEILDHCEILRDFGHLRSWQINWMTTYKRDSCRNQETKASRFDPSMFLEIEMWGTTPPYSNDWTNFPPPPASSDNPEKSSGAPQAAEQELIPVYFCHRRVGAWFVSKIEIMLNFSQPRLLLAAWGKFSNWPFISQDFQPFPNHKIISSSIWVDCECWKQRRQNPRFSPRHWRRFSSK